MADGSGTTVARAMATRHGLPFVDLWSEPLDEVALQALPEPALRRAHAVPYKLDDGVLHVAVADPTAAQALQAESRYPLVLAVAAREQISEALTSLTDTKFDTAWRRDQVTVVGDDRTPHSSAPAVAFVNGVLADAMAQRASDIHFIPGEDGLFVKGRIDGMLIRLTEVRSDQAAAVISRLKVMAKLDIAEHRQAQDGRISLQTSGGRLFDARVAVLPTVAGEGVIIRLLETTRAAPTLSAIGLSEEMQMALERLIRRPQGALLVTGPTGSGKTTTLYAALADLARPELNVITVEDPVEYRLLGAYQLQVDHRSGMGFAESLRAVLRGDPDVIMIGEIRDTETARLATAAAMTGHRVLATLHTNDAPTAIARLAELGVDPREAASATNGILAQRLVRRLCVRCRETYVPPTEEIVRLGYERQRAAAGDIRFFRAGVGCRHCSGGYRGRVGVFQLLPITAGVAHAVEDAAALSLAAVEAGMVSLWSDGLGKAENGLTSLEELRRVLTP